MSGMDSAHRWAMLRNMATSLIYHERIMTTTPKAKELRRVVEKVVYYSYLSVDSINCDNSYLLLFYLRLPMQKKAIYIIVDWLQL